MTPTSIRAFIRWMYRNRSIRITPDGTRFLLFTIGIGVAAINTGNNLFYLLLAMMLSLIVISGLLSEQCLRRLEYRRHQPDLIVANEPSTVTLAVANRHQRLPSFSLRLRDVVAGQDVDRGLFISHLPARSTVHLSYPILATKRGWMRCEGIRAETLFPFGLFLKKALYTQDSPLLVAPPIQPLTVRFVDELVSEGQGHPLARRGSGSQLYNLRLYQPGDDSRSIHWMTTARTAQLIVRETEADDQQRITVMLSTLAPETADALFERSVTFVASLLWQLTERAHPVRLIVGAEDSGLESGSAHLSAMLRLLALCQRRKPASDGEEAFPLSGNDPGQGYTLAIVPWSDPAILEQVMHADRVLQADQLEELTHAF